MIQSVDTDRVPSETRRAYRQAGLIALGGNLLLAAAKGIVAWRTGSSAIYADAANSLSDLAYSLLMLVGLWFALRPPDAGHPHGHRRAEPFVSLLIGIAMAAAGFEAARSGVRGLLAGSRPTLDAWPLVVLALSALIKTGMYLRVRRLGQQAGSPALCAAAKDNLSDVITSSAAVAGAFASLLWGPADAITAWGVAVWILRAAWEVVHEAADQLLGGSPSPELQEAIIAAVRSVPGVIMTDRVILEHQGPQVYADIHIRMDGDTTLEVVHRTSHEVRDRVQALRAVDHAYIHVEPWPLREGGRSGGDAGSNPEAAP